MQLGLEGRTALVTAGSKGIGAATVRTLLAEGATVSCCARDPEALSALEASAAAAPGKLHTFQADLADPAAVERVVTEAQAQIGPIEILVNNLGASPSRNFLYMSAEDWQLGLQLNLLAAVQATQLVLPEMRHRKWGRVIMVSSGAAKYPSPALVDYAAAKAAIVSVGKSLARKYGGDGVLVNSVLPGLIRTDMWERTAAELAKEGDTEGVFVERSARVPVGRFGTATEVAEVIAFLASERSSFLNGVALDVDGGMGDHVF